MNQETEKDVICWCGLADAPWLSNLIETTEKHQWGEALTIKTRKI